MKNQKTSVGKNRNSDSAPGKITPPVPPDSEKDLDDLSHERLNRTGKGNLATEDLDDLAHRELEQDGQENIGEEDFEPRKK